MEPNKSVSYILKIDLHLHGSFEQTITVSGAPTTISQKGTWNIDGGHIDLDHVLVEEWDSTTEKGLWKPESTRWDIIDAFGGGFEIFGGLFDDPDSWRAFNKAR